MEKSKERKYEKPVIKKQEKMTFPIKIMSSQNRKLACKQCSSCHGCR